MDTYPLRIVGASRPFPGETENGDAWQVDWCGDACRLTIIDGLGHGPEAAKAAAVGLRALKSSPFNSPIETIHRCHAALGGTRGAVMGVVVIDCRANRLVWAGVGNTDGVVARSGGNVRLISYRGIVGASLPTVRTMEVDLGDRWCVLLHTDGVHERYDLNTELEDASTSDCWPTEFLERWGRITDDATVVCAMPLDR